MMSEIILHHDGVYNFYNTISDGARFVSGITLEQLRHVIETEDGLSGLSRLSSRLERAHATGTSSHLHESLNELLLTNRAGEHETKLSDDEFISRFLTLKK